MIAALLVPVILSACFAVQTTLTGDSPAVTAAGFWKGFWHGLIAPVAFVVSLFADHVRIYAMPNSGHWYDFGFMLGIGGFSGGIFAGSKPRTRVVTVRRRNDDAI